MQCSNDPVLGGDPSLHNPEDLLLSALSSCHMLWYLHLASNAGIAVLGYEDVRALAVGETETEWSRSSFLSATLRPTITVPEGTDLTAADTIHGEIHKVCFIARSVNFPVRFEASYKIA